MAIIGFEIEKCNECPLHRTERTITSDSFEYALDYYCTVITKLLINTANQLANCVVFQNGVH